MQIGNVVGHATATVKHPSMTSWKLLVVQPLTLNEKEDGEPILVIDTLGAGLGSRVLVCSDSAGVQQLMKQKATPVRWFVMGICDQ